jgi:hypothetical protein
LRAWTQFRGYSADVFSQLVDSNPDVPAGHGFTFADLKAEIDVGYPVLLFLQPYSQVFRNLAGMPRANPDIHAILAYGYYLTDDGGQFVRYRTSWGDGNTVLARWSSAPWIPNFPLPVRGAIGYHPLPQVTKVTPGQGSLRIEWEGPAAVLTNIVTQTLIPLNWYVVEKAGSLASGSFQAVTDPTTEHSAMLTNCCPEAAAFYRLKLLPATSNW